MLVLYRQCRRTRRFFPSHHQHYILVAGRLTEDCYLSTVDITRFNVQCKTALILNEFLYFFNRWSCFRCCRCACLERTLTSRHQCIVGGDVKNCSRQNCITNLLVQMIHSIRHFSTWLWNAPMQLHVSPSVALIFSVHNNNNNNKHSVSRFVCSVRTVRSNGHSYNFLFQFFFQIPRDPWYRG